MPLVLMTGFPAGATRSYPQIYPPVIARSEADGRTTWRSQSETNPVLRHSHMTVVATGMLLPLDIRTPDGGKYVIPRLRK